MGSIEEEFFKKAETESKRQRRAAPHPDGLNIASEAPLSKMAIAALVFAGLGLAATALAYFEVSVAGFPPLTFLIPGAGFGFLGMICSVMPGVRIKVNFDAIAALPIVAFFVCLAATAAPVTRVGAALGRMASEARAVRLGVRCGMAEARLHAGRQRYLGLAAWSSESNRIQKDS